MDSKPYKILDTRQHIDKKPPREYLEWCPTLNATLYKEPYLVVYGQTKSTNTLAKSTEKTTEKENYMKGTSQQLIPTTSPTMTSWLADFLAKHSALQVSEQDSVTLGELCFLKSQGFSTTTDPNVFYSKMSKAYYLTTLEKLSKQYLKFSPTLGIELNGRYLILKTSEFHRTGNECSLSDILESEVEDKYFLSETKTKSLVLKSEVLKPLVDTTSLKDAIPQTD